MVGWRRVLVYTHRWLGTAGALLFIAWFVSGIVLMYVGMPDLPVHERSRGQSLLDISTATLTPAEGASRANATPEQMHVGMLDDRPVYRFSSRGQWTTVYADNGEMLSGLTSDEALQIARRFAPEHAATVSYDQKLVDADQWTIQAGPYRPLHRVSLGDDEDTRLYVSDRTGELVMKTTAWGRRWAYGGAVLHWLYFTPFRKHTQLWIQSVIWLAIIGCVHTLSGLLWGLWRVATRPRYRLRNQEPSRSPYSGQMRWHHYAGLLFGFTTFTWVLSGCLSLDPFGWHPGTAPTLEQRVAVRDGTFRLGTVTLDGLQAAAEAIADAFPLQELELVQFGGEVFARAQHTSTSEARLASVATPEQGSFPRFDRDDLLAAARRAMPAASILDSVWLDEYDSYYYGRSGTRPLPVLRVRYDDPDETWLYLDPYIGAIARKEVRLTRLNRWIYHGLHSLDFPFLYEQRPAWDIVVIGLSLGGLVLSATTLTQAGRRLRRHGRRALVVVKSRARQWRGPTS